MVKPNCVLERTALIGFASYRKLNSATKADTFPLPRIDDLLEQLGKSEYFSTLDLTAGF